MNFCNRFIFLFLSLLSLNFARGQKYFSSDYTRLQYDSIDPAEFDVIEKSYKDALETLNIRDKKLKKQTGQLLLGISNELRRRNNGLLLMSQDTLTAYLNALVKRIQERNSIASGSYTVLPYRTSVPNAANMGQGVLLINIGLIAKLNTEAELAYIICHEMAHDIQSHVLNGIVKRQEIIYSPEFQQRLKAAERMVYNSYRESQSIFYSFLTEYTEHSRDNEYEADSIGLFLFTNAGYDPKEAVNTIRLLDSIDQEPEFYLDYPRYFNFKNYPYRPEWLQYEAGHKLGGNLKFDTPDSLKTHPDCADRSKALERIIASQKVVSAPLPYFADYAFYGSLAKFEMLEILMSQKNYGSALYQAIRLQTLYPENTYLKCCVTECFYEIYSALVAHTFSSSVEFPNSYNDTGYNDYLKFIHNLNGSTYRNLCVNYYEDHVAGGKSTEYSAYVSMLVKSLDLTPAEKAGLAAEYSEKFGENYYYQLLKNKFKLPEKKRR